MSYCVVTRENVLITISDKILDTGDSAGERTEWNRVRFIAQECERLEDLCKFSTTTMGVRGFDYAK